MYGVNEIKVVDKKIIELKDLLAKDNLDDTEKARAAELWNQNLWKQRGELTQAAITQAGGRKDIVDLFR
jgi:hypothetical protein